MLGQSVEEREPWEGRVKLGQRIVAVRIPDYPVAALTFDDGFEASFDLGWLVESGPAFSVLRDPALFATAHPGSGGASLEWIGRDGEEMDLSADALRMEAEGIWDPQARRWTR